MPLSTGLSVTWIDRTALCIFIAIETLLYNTANYLRNQFPPSETVGNEHRQDLTWPSQTHRVWYKTNAIWGCLHH